LFNPTPTLLGVVGDTLAAAFNPQLAAWSHAPAAAEIEAHLLRFLGERLGYPARSTAQRGCGRCPAGPSCTRPRKATWRG
jgi:glutamate/tyrosine decarboxylase-like PLP-dependent enzyme